MIRAFFVTNSFRPLPGGGRKMVNPLIEALNVTIGGLDDKQRHHNPLFVNGYPARPFSMIVCYSSVIDLEQFAVLDGVDMLPPIKADKQMPALPDQARANLSQILSNRQIPDGVVVGTFIGVLNNIASIVSPERPNIGEWSEYLPGEFG